MDRMSAATGSLICSCRLMPIVFVWWCVDCGEIGLWPPPRTVERSWSFASSVQCGLQNRWSVTCSGAWTRSARSSRGELYLYETTGRRVGPRRSYSPLIAGAIRRSAQSGQILGRPINDDSVCFSAVLHFIPIFLVFRLFFRFFWLALFKL
jgi:hypothetical protein